jgi:hypothetical protein
VTHRILIAILLAAIGLGIGAFAWHAEETARAERVKKRTALLIPRNAAVQETEHYRIHYTGTADDAALVGGAVEKLYAAYAAVFPRTTPATPGKLILVLYKDRTEFKSNNRSSQWAEAYYLPPGVLRVLRRHGRESVSLDAARGDASAVAAVFRLSPQPLGR